MYISLNWIRDYVDINDVDVDWLLNKFTLSTAEVEGYERKGTNVSGVIVARIAKVDAHPNSKKLHLLKVDTGREIVDVVCGAPNVREGLTVAFATPGANVGDMHIQPAMVGGYMSNGMCCGADELGISDEHYGLLELPDNYKLGTDIKDYLDIDDVVFEVDNKSLTNRPDLWGHYGIAREIAALTGKKLKKLSLYTGKFGKNPLDISIDSANCYRYTSTTVANITRKVSPINMQIRLYYAGMRPINLLTDLTNYVMLECGQPMHAFDNSIVHSIKVIDAAADTKFVTLDKQTRNLPAGTTCITSAGNVVAVAGVMGGLDSEITNGTNSVLIESACFDGAPIRKTALALGMRTEASARYEKMLDPELTKISLLRYLYLLHTIDGGVSITSALTDIYKYHYKTKTIEVTKTFIDKFIGISIDTNKIVDILESLAFKVKKAGEKFIITVPTFRATKDIQGKQDIVEEITRIYGYDNLPALSTLQKVEPVLLDDNIALEYDAKYALATKFGYHEVHSYIWYDEATLKQLQLDVPSVLHIVNALGKENNAIRATMVPSMLKVVVDNVQSYSNINVFEIGRVVPTLLSDGQADEHKNLCLVKYSSTLADTQLLVEIKKEVEYVVKYVLCKDIEFKKANPQFGFISPANSYQVYVGGSNVGYIGLIHPFNKKNIQNKCGLAVAELDFGSVVKATSVQTKFAKVSRFPVTGLDFTFVIPGDKLYADIHSIATSLNTTLNYQVKLVDIYEANGIKSYTLHYDICLFDRTLSSADIEQFHTLVIDTFKQAGINLKL